MQPNHFGPHYLVSPLMLEHAILVNTGLVGESIGPDDGLVGLDRDTGVVGHHTTYPGDLGGINPCLQLISRLPGAERHDNLFKGGVASTFSYAINGYLCLPGPSL